MGNKVPVPDEPAFVIPNILREKVAAGKLGLEPQPIADEG